MLLSYFLVLSIEHQHLQHDHSYQLLHKNKQGDCSHYQYTVHHLSELDQYPDHKWHCYEQLKLQNKNILTKLTGLSLPS